MLKLITTNQFEKDFRRMAKRGKDREKLLQVMQKLLNEEQLAPARRDHKLRGPLTGRRECHIEPDWLLIYVKKADSIIFERTGTHSDLFR
jgi:mRNA interferase YafQ